MSTPPPILAQIRQLIAQDKSAEAMELMRQLLDKSPALAQLIMQSARHSRIMAAIRQGIAPFDEANRERNQINQALLEMLNDIDTEIGHNNPAQMELRRFEQGQHHSGSGDNVGRDKNIHNNYINHVPIAANSLQAHLLPTERDIFFVGRADIMADIQQNLAQQKPVLLLNGVGGIGKTALALHYALEHQAQYQTIRWIDYSHSLEDSYYNALNPHYRFEGTVKEVFDRIRHAENQCPPDRLLIIDNFDNADDKQALHNYFAQWKVLITTRISQLDPRRFTELPIDELNEDDAVALFKYHYDCGDAPFDEQSVKKLLPLIYYNTLLIVLLARIARDSDGLSNPQKLYEQYRDRQFEHPYLQIDIDTDDYRTPKEKQKARNLLACLQIAFDISEIQDPDQIYLLQQLSLMPHTGVPIPMLREWLPYLPPTEFTNALNALARKGWINKKDSLVMHPLVQQLVQFRYPPTPQQHEQLIDNLVRAIFEKGKGNYLEAVPLVPYGYAVANALYKTFDAQNPNAVHYNNVATLCNNLSAIYQAMGKMDLALEVQHKAIAIAEKILGKDHPDLATSYNNLSSIYKAMGKMDLALAEQQKAIAIREKVLDKGHPDLATSYNNLSGIYQAMGKMDLALAEQQKAIAIQEKVLGEDHPDLAASYNNLSMIYRAMGKMDLALAEQQKAIAIKEQVLGKDHPDLATSYNNLSGIYRAMGKMDLALEYSLKDIVIVEKVLDKDHPDLAASYNNLSGIYRAMGKMDLALAEQQKAIAVQEKVLGKDHPDLATSYNNLSGIYQAMGKMDLALEYSLKDIAIAEKILGKDHPNLATSYNNLSVIYQAMGKMDLALAEQQKAIAIQEKVLGKDHPNLATSYNNLSGIYQAMGKMDLALEYSLKDIAIAEKVLDKDHPDLAASYNNLSGIYRAMGKMDLALAEQQKVIAIREKVLGKDHPNLATSYNNLSGIYQAMGKMDLALAEQQKAIAIREKVLGKDHPNLATSYNNLSGIYQATGNMDLALAEQQKAIAIREKVLGKDHPNLATSYNNLSGIYQATGNMNLALAEQQKAIAIREKVLGKDHPDLATSYNNLSFIYYEMGDIVQAATYINEAVRILQYNFPNGHPYLSSALQFQKQIRFIQLVQAQDFQSIMQDEEMRGWLMELKNGDK